MSDRRVNIVGVGNTLMGDDGLGPAVIEAISRRGVPPGVRLYDAGLAISDVLGTLEPSEALVVIDAVRAGGQPGSVYEARLPEMSLAGDSLRGALSLHEISALPALQLEALSGREFNDVTVFGVEPAVVAWGEGLSPAVAGAIEPLVESILKHAVARRAGGGAERVEPGQETHDHERHGAKT